ncbi:hypothetical protein LJB92_01830 [Bacteroidales bacterium OttesenSCG-928-M06]|nr:hypothetical protein [Bacteroidales bacterium OttesenSCG-928-M06]
MNRNIIYLITLISILFLVSSCDNEDNKYEYHEDPEGTVEVELGKDHNLVVFYHAFYVNEEKNDSTIAPISSLLGFVSFHYDNILTITPIKEEVDVYTYHNLKGLGNIRSLPKNGWTNKNFIQINLLVKEKNGYILRFRQRGEYIHVRLFIDEIKMEEEKQVIKIKFQYPFMSVPIYSM